MEGFQNKIEKDRDESSQKNHKKNFFFCKAVDLYLCFVSLIGIFEPGNHGENGDRGSHAEIGNHFPVIGEGKRNDAV